jgi:UDP-N-acetylmuramate dehydrogenase
MRIEENIPLSTLTTFRTGGPARFLLTLESREEVLQAVAFAKEKKLPLIPLGHGSNMLPPDAGLSAVLLRYLPDGVAVEKENRSAIVTAEAGLSWDALAERAVREGWWGIENLSAIPGTVGAAVVQNIGAYGAAVESTLLSVEAYDTKAEAFVTLLREQCRFGYRTSIFKQESDRYFITAVTFEFPLHSEPNLTYADMQAYFKEHAGAPTLGELREAIRTIRGNKFPSLAEFGTAGSFFLNPIFTQKNITAIRSKYPEMPVYKLPEGGIKIPLAWIFDQIMHAKGRAEGGAVIWDKQPLVIVTKNGGTTRDVVALAKSVVDDFYRVTDMKIMPEVRLFGDDKATFL